MADVEDKEKAEKLAAAKKRFEQLKKQQKGKKGGAKKKEEKIDDTAVPEPDANVKAEEEAIEEPNSTAEETPKDSPGDVAESMPPADTDSNATRSARQPSLSIQSKQRSESFRRGSTAALSPGLKSPSIPPLGSGEEVQDIYRKQAARIEELGRENKTLAESVEKLERVEEELEQLREGSGQVAELKAKALLADDRAKEIERLNTELTSAQRQLSQAQQSAAIKNRRTSGASPSASDLSAQLASKTSTIESLELELSNLRNQVNILESDKSSNEISIQNLEQRAIAAESSASNAQKEVETLKASLSSSAADTSKSTDEDPTALNNKISVLQSDLRSAQSSADAAVSRATSLEQKIDAMTKLHRESSATTTLKDKEIRDLKARIATLTARSPNPAGAEEIEDLEDEEREKLHARIRDLEAETFELRRGVWRDKRAALQPGMADDDADASAVYEDVDLSAAGTPYAARVGLGARGSSFQDVLASGISAFTGRDRRRSNDGQAPGYGGHGRNQSLGLLSEEGFDEDAFAMAHEEEAKRRIERIKDVKRGLEQWRGWRVDLVDLRAAGLGGAAAAASTGPVFEV